MPEDTFEDTDAQGVVHIRRSDIENVASLVTSIIESNAEATQAVKRNTNAIVELTQVYGNYLAQDRQKLAKLYEVVMEGNGKPSLKSRADAFDDFVGTFKRLGWIVAGVLTAQAIGYLLWFFYTVTTHVQSP